MLNNILSTQAFIDAIPINSVVYRYDEDDFIIIAFNKLAEKTEEISRNEVIGKRLTEAFPGVKEFGLFDILLHVHTHGGIKDHQRSYYEDERISGWRHNRVSRLQNGDVMTLYDDLTKERSYEKENFKNKRRLEEAEQIAHLGHWEWNMMSDTMAWSDETYRIFSEQPQSFEPTFKKFISYFNPKDQICMQEYISHAIKFKTFYTVDFKIQRKDGDVCYIQCSGRVELDDQGEPIIMIGTVLDITTRYKLDKKLKYLGNIVENSHNEVYIFNAENFSFTYANKTVQHNLGYSLEEMLGMTFLDIVPSYTKQTLLELIESLQNGSHEYLVFNTLHQRKNGSGYTAEIRLQLTEINGYKQFVVISQDITQRIYLEEVLKKQATTDFLTDIYNRLKTTEELEIELNRVKRYGGVFGLAMFDLDHFKAINDTYGHDIGDYVLKEITSVISKQIRKSDRFGRWGGEEFIIILPGLGKEDVVAFTQKLREIIAGYTFQNISQVTISFGVTIFNHEDTKESILKRVDQALYKAKEEGRNRVVFH